VVRFYSVPGVSCEHCRSAITQEVGKVPGVDSVEVNLELKLVTVEGEPDDGAVRAAIDRAGYDIEEHAVEGS
jgi:copper chaperone